MLEGGSLALAAAYALLERGRSGFAAVVLATGLARRTRFAG